MRRASIVPTRRGAWGGTCPPARHGAAEEGGKGEGGGGRAGPGQGPPPGRPWAGQQTEGGGDGGDGKHDQGRGGRLSRRHLDGAGVAEPPGVVPAETVGGRRQQAG